MEQSRRAQGQVIIIEELSTMLMAQINAENHIYRYAPQTEGHEEDKNGIKCSESLQYVISELL